MLTIASPSFPSPPPHPPACAQEAISRQGGGRCTANIRFTPCLNEQTCLTIDRPYYLAFIAGTCVAAGASSNVYPTSNTCFCIESQNYGQYVDYYSTGSGFVLSAAMKRDLYNAGHPQAPPAGDGEPPSDPQHTIPLCPSMRFDLNVCTSQAQWEHPYREAHATASMRA